MNKLIEQLYAGHPQLDLYLGVIETTEGIIKRHPEDAWLQGHQGNREAMAAVQEDFCAAGLMGLGVSEEQGGLGEGLLGPVLAMDLMAQHGLGTFKALATYFSRVPVLTHGTQAQFDKYARPTLTGEASFCILATEPNAGTNSFNISTRASRRGEGWVLNGQKIFISGAPGADYGFLIAKTDIESAKAMSVFILDMKSPGITMNKMNIRAFADDDQYTVFFDDVEMPADALIGDEGRGAAIMFDGLNAERFVVSALALGAADLALRMACDYVGQRKIFDGRLTGAYQAVQHPLAQHKAELDAARLMLYYGVKRADAGLDAGAQANMAKLLASQVATKMCDAAIQFHGGSGMDEDVGLMALWRSARALQIAPLNNEMILNYIAQHVLNLPRSY